jgi:N utilization substance protein B
MSPVAACWRSTPEYESFRLGKEVDGATYREADAQWFRAILSGVVESQKTIDPVIRQALTEDWPLSRLDSRRCARSCAPASMS